MYKFRMPVGDWSDDGHGKYVSYLVGSNQPIDVVRELDSFILKKTGIKLNDICGDYQESTLSKETVDKLLELGFSFETASGIDVFSEECDEEDIASILSSGADYEIHMSPDSMIELWLFLLKKVYPALDISVLDNEIDTLHHCNGQVGYGVFD